LNNELKKRRVSHISSREYMHIRGLTIKFTNSPACACRGSNGQKLQHGLITLAYQHFIAALLLIYGRLFLSGVYYCLECILVCRRDNVRTNIKFLVKLGKTGSEITVSIAAIIFHFSHLRFCMEQSGPHSDRMISWKC
jgi:hypothetical protein